MTEVNDFIDDIYKQDYKDKNENRIVVKHVKLLIDQSAQSKNNKEVIKEEAKELPSELSESSSESGTESLDEYKNKENEESEDDKDYTYEMVYSHRFGAFFYEYSNKPFNNKLLEDPLFMTYLNAEGVDLDNVKPWDLRSYYKSYTYKKEEGAHLKKCIICCENSLLAQSNYSKLVCAHCERVNKNVYIKNYMCNEIKNFRNLVGKFYLINCINYFKNYDEFCDIYNFYNHRKIIKELKDDTFEKGKYRNKTFEDVYNNYQSNPKLLRNENYTKYVKSVKEYNSLKNHYKTTKDTINMSFIKDNKDTYKKYRAIHETYRGIV